MAIKYEPPKPTLLETLKRQCKEIKENPIGYDYRIPQMAMIISDLCDEVQRLEDLVNQGRKIG